ncbi:MAG: DedA family protein [Alphaproteobacteria bacterium]|nr:DedA family protein [Alphaproteobacteria bacterium]
MEEWLLDLVHTLGYLGVFIATLIESTFVPIPAEMTMIPAGILAAKGEFNYWMVLFSSTLGVIAGSLVNYWIGLRFGRALIIRYGKYIFIKHSFLEKTEKFFARYGGAAAFMGRLLPVVRHYIAFVAGIARMKLQPFFIYSSLGGLIWMWILLQVGFMAERSKENGITDISSLDMTLIAVAIISLFAWLIKNRLMKH